jgi:hypothetical protein
LPILFLLKVVVHLFFVGFFFLFSSTWYLAVTFRNPKT